MLHRIEYIIHGRASVDFCVLNSPGPGTLTKVGLPCLFPNVGARGVNFTFSRDLNLDL